ncbi:MAG: alpha/beta hydrolase [Candidatus Sericytochromatia bacterium]
MKHISKLLLISFILFSCTNKIDAYKILQYNQASTTYITKNRNGYFHNRNYFKSKDNIDLFEQSWIPENSDKVLIIMHGLKDHSSRYEAFAQKLVKNNISVYAFDLRGHGYSRGEKVWVNSFDEYIDDLDLFYKRIKEKEKNKKIFIMGHSMGGAIATLFAMEKKPEINSLILSAPALKVGKDISEFKIGLVNFLSGVFPHLGLLELDDNGFSRDKKVIEDMKKDPLIYQSNGAAKTANELLKSLVKINSKISDFNYNFIVLHGTDDKITNPEGSDELYKKSISQKKEIKKYKGFYHDLLHEPNNEIVYDDIYNWIANN